MRSNSYCILLHQVLWTFSIYLEAVAILPQLVLLQRTQNIDNLTGNYVFLLGWVDAFKHCMLGCSIYPLLLFVGFNVQVSTDISAGSIVACTS